MYIATLFITAEKGGKKPMSVNGQMRKQNVVSSYDRILFSNEKKKKQ